MTCTCKVLKAVPLAAAGALMSLWCFMAQAQELPNLPPLDKVLKAEETALVLIDIQNNFAAPKGEHYPRYEKIFQQTKMLEKTVDLVKQARELGIQVIHVTEGYSTDFRELDWGNVGAFHRAQIVRQAWKTGTWEVEIYEPLRPGPADRDIQLPNRITVSGFGSNGLDYILKSKGIRNVAFGGFSTEGCVYATLLSGYDLGYRMYAISDAMASTRIELSKLLLEDSYPKYSRVMGAEAFLQMFNKDVSTVSRN